MKITTLIVAIVALVVVIAGAIETITRPDVLSFKAYLDALTGPAVAAGLLGIGHALNPGDADVVSEPAPEPAQPAMPDVPNAGQTPPPVQPPVV